VYETSAKANAWYPKFIRTLSIAIVSLQYIPTLTTYVAHHHSHTLPTMPSAMSQRLQGKTVLVTGASSGIGKSTALEFARTCPHDLKLILTARRLENLKQLAGEINKEVGSGVQVLPVQLDISKPSEVHGFVSRLPPDFQQIDMLVNNA
jgi:3-hydroxy acid dehydrogenase/malonic semialdehyde reductase